MSKDTENVGKTYLGNIYLQCFSIVIASKTRYFRAADDVL